MQSTSHSAYGTTSSVYICSKNEKIPKHVHPVTHSTSVASGKSEVEIYDGRPIFEMKVGDTPFILPANIFHEIRALEDNTVIINIIEGESKPHTYTDNGPNKPHGGVMLDDGTIVYE